MQHTFWGKITENFGEYMTSVQFPSNFFQGEHEFYLGDLYDEDGEEIEEQPTTEQLDEFTETYQSFIQHWTQLLAQLQEKAFTRYQKLYAHYYENPDKSGEKTLNINSIEKHNSYILDLLNIRIGADQTVRLAINYQLDTEHGLEFKFVNNELVDVAGIAET